MRKTILTLVLTGLVIAGNQGAYARDKDWATAGKILTGIIGLGILADAVAEPSRPVYSQTTYYSSSSTNCQPQGHYESYNEQVWIPGETRKYWVDPVYETRCHHGRRIYVLVREGYYQYETLPGHYEVRTATRWVNGY